jgi:hypothetical protein
MYKRIVLLFAIFSISLVLAHTTIDFFGITVPVDEKTSGFIQFSTTTASGNDPSSPSIKVTDGSKTKFYVDAKDSFDCRTGELNISVPDGIIGGKIGLISESPPYPDMVIKPIDGNITKFIVLYSGTYSLVQYDFPSYVQLNDFRKIYTLCPEEQAPVIQEPVTIEEKSVQVQEQTPPSTTKTDAVSAITLANAAINSAYESGNDVSVAQAKLTEAKVVLSVGDYKQAKELAEEAFELAKSAKAKTVSSTAPTTASVKQAVPTIDVTILVAIITVLFMLVMGHIFMISKNKK